jgi:hypothetical protein
VAAEGCALADAANRRDCIRGVLYALIDHTWDATYALPFCASLTDAADIEYCFTESGMYLGATFARSRDELAEQCYRHLSEPAVCLKTLAR